VRIPNTLSPIEAAVKLNTSVKRVLELIAEKKLEAINTGKGKVRPRWAIPQEQIDALAKPKQVSPVVNVKRHV
jgi:excisionase family DNA binding protein